MSKLKSIVSLLLIATLLTSSFPILANPQTTSYSPRIGSTCYVIARTGNGNWINHEQLFGKFGAISGIIIGTIIGAKSTIAGILVGMFSIASELLKPESTVGVKTLHSYRYIYEHGQVYYPSYGGVNRWQTRATVMSRVVNLRYIGAYPNDNGEVINVTKDIMNAEFNYSKNYGKKYFIRSMAYQSWLKGLPNYEEVWSQK